MIRLISLEDARDFPPSEFFKRVHVSLQETGRRPISLPVLKPSRKPWDMGFDVRQSEMVDFVVRLDFEDDGALMEFHLTFDGLALGPHELAVHGHRIRSAVLCDDMTYTERQVRLWLRGS